VHKRIGAESGRNLQEDSTGRAERGNHTTAENIDWIVQEIDQYQKEIENIREQLTPTTPPAVKEKRK
jgi:cob(I)alamin adenosyltransferase